MSIIWMSKRHWSQIERYPSVKPILKKHKSHLRMLDTTHQEVEAMIKWLKKRMNGKTISAFLWGDVGAIVRIVNGRALVCLQSKEQVEEILLHSKFIDNHITFVHCPNHPHPIQQTIRVNATDNPQVYQEYMQIVKGLMRDGYECMDIHMFLNASNCFKQAFKRSKEFEFASLKTKIHIQVEIIRNLFTICDTQQCFNIYYLLKYYKRLHKFHTLLPKDFDTKRALLKSKRIINHNLRNRNVYWLEFLNVEWLPLKVKRIYYKKIELQDYKVLKYLSRYDLYAQISRKIETKSCQYCRKYTTNKSINKSIKSKNKKKKRATKSITKMCSHCRLAYYCNKACQKKHWKKHKLVCYSRNSKNVC